MASQSQRLLCLCGGFFGSGPRTEAHLIEALPVLDLKLTEEDCVELDQVVPRGSAVADFHNTSGWMMRMRL